MINTLKLLNKQLLKDKNKIILLRLKRKRVVNKIGNKCVLKDGLGLDNLYRMILLLMHKVFQIRLYNMENREFPSLKIGWQKLSKSNI